MLLLTHIQQIVMGGRRTMSSENREAIKKKNWENFGSVSFQFGILPSFLRDFLVEGGGWLDLA